MDFPSFFNVKSAKLPKKRFPLKHAHVTTMDFFQLVPLCCREVVPNDDMTIRVRSAVRMMPMPFPTYGSIKFHNRAFFVPYRTIMEGWNEFIEDVNYYSSSGAIRIGSVPYFTNDQLCHVLLDLSGIIGEQFYWRQSADQESWDVLVDNTGKVVTYSFSSGYYSHLCFSRKNTTGNIYASGVNIISDIPVAGSMIRSCLEYGISALGSATTQVVSSVRYLLFDTTSYDSGINFSFQVTRDFGSAEYEGAFSPITISGSSYQLAPVSETSFDDVAFDFKWQGAPYRFTNAGRYAYNLLLRLGYRVNFSNSLNWEGDYVFTSTKQLSAGKLLAFVKIYLDWYTPSQYAESNTLQGLFVGTDTSGRHITNTELAAIFNEVRFSCYNRDYFTSAWQNPSGPNVKDSQVSILDTSVSSNSSDWSAQESAVINYNDAENFIGSNNGTPTLAGTKAHGVPNNKSPYNISYFILESLRALTNFTRRHQLSGFRVVDRYLAEHGVKLDDSQLRRSQNLGSHMYDARIQDIMSTADTQGAALGDFAGKGLAFTDDEQPHVFHLQSGEKEYGFIIVIASVVPNTGYVQGIMRENLHLRRLDFHHGDFDNLGTQAIRRDELFGDAGLARVDDPSEVATTTGDDALFGFAPRFIEYKIGYDFLTGDFAIPSRRKGMDAFHLFRLFPDAPSGSIDRSFTIGEQEQYDRIFNNVDSEYDHFYCVNDIFIDSQRSMKSVTDVYDFEHAPGQDITVDANGTQIN